MHVMKFYEGKLSAPRYAALVRVDAQGWLLVNEPTHLPYTRRTARWINPARVRVMWVREFIDEPVPAGCR